MAEYTFAQLVDLMQVRQLLEAHHRLSGMAYGLFDTEENNLVAVGWQDICVRFHRTQPLSCLRCRESDAFIKAHLRDLEGDFLEYRCKNGMIDVAMPIVIEGEHAATFFTGQFFYDDTPPDPEFFRTQAAAFGFDTESYLAALARVPVFSREHVRDNMLFLRNMVDVLAKCGLNNLRLTREAEKRERTEEQLCQREEEFRSLAENTPDTIARYDRECRRLYANRAFADLAGRPVAELLGTTPSVSPAAPGAAEYEARIRAVFRSGRTDELELTWPDCDGQLITSHICIVPERDQHGQVTSVLSIGRDITALKETEQEPRDTRSRLTAVLNAIPDPIWMKDTAGRFLGCNPAFEAFMGVSEAGVIGKTIYDLVDSNLADILTGKNREAIISGRSSSYEERIWSAGHNRWTILELRKIPVHGHNDRLLGVLSISRDITERKRTERLLYQREQEFRTLVENAPDPIIRYDCDGRRLYVNPVMERLSGKPVTSLLGSMVTDTRLVPAPVGQRIARYIKQVAATGCTFETEVELAGSEGQRLFFLNSYAPEFGPDGEVESVLSISRNITERKQMEMSLRESEETLRSFLENMPAGCLWTDHDGNIEYLNQFGKELIGYSLEEVPTLEALFERIYPDPTQRRRIATTYRKNFFKEEEVEKSHESVETHITRKDGTSRQVIVNAHPVGNRLLAVLTDITERAHLQNELLKAQKLESLEVMVGGIAHDFNNIITGILGHISIAKHSLDPASKAHNSLGIAEAASQRAADLNRRLLAFARGNKPVKKRIALPPLLDETVSLALDGNKVQGIVHVEGLLPDIEADEGQLIQVFTNILVNGAQAMPTGGTITIRADKAAPHECKIMGLRPGPFVRIAFTDEGCGISEQDQKRIFDPYFTTKIKGHGLGLTSCHAIVANHGGRLTVSSAIGVGSTFTVYLPSLGVTSRQASNGHGERSAAPVPGTVLVMNDDKRFRSPIIDMLHYLGCRRTACTDVREAVALCREARERDAPFDAIIMELHMAADEKAVRHLLAEAPQTRLILSGESDHPLMKRYADHGFAGILPKPYTVSRLAKVMHDLGRAGR